VQTDEEMLERVLQNSGYPGNGLRHDHQQLACSSLVFMIGLPELSLMTLVSEESPSLTGLNKQSTHARFNNLILNLKAQPSEMFALLGTLWCNQKSFETSCAEKKH